MFVFQFIIIDIFFVNIKFLYLIHTIAFFIQLQDLHTVFSFSKINGHLF